MSNDKLAFFIGLLGSLHCVGMCGPLAFAVPLNSKGWIGIVSNKLVYQIGRIISYCLLGALVGTLGMQIWQSGSQQLISMITGLLILLAAANRLFKLSFLNGKNNRLSNSIQRLSGLAFRHKANHLIIGMLNGFLPCGFVYLALAGALNTESFQAGISYMFWFGIGTSPLMFSASIIAGFAGLRFRRWLNQIIPYTMALIGIWFILRGMELNIAYLSPAKPATSVTTCK